MRTFLVCLGLVCLTLSSFSQQVPKSLTAQNGERIGFYQFTPYNYNANPTRKYPLIIFMHGIGERGNGTTDLSKVLYFGIPANINNGSTMTFNVNGKDETFIVLSPQLSTN